MFFYTSEKTCQIHFTYRSNAKHLSFVAYCSPCDISNMNNHVFEIFIQFSFSSAKICIDKIIKGKDRFLFPALGLGECKCTLFIYVVVFYWLKV